MKALILSAGLGTRLGDLTKDIPKVMMDLNGKSCLERHIRSLMRQGIKEIAINTHYFPEQIKEILGDGSSLGVKIKYSFEEKLLGTSGALNNFRDFFDEDYFVVIYGDVVADFDVKNLVKEHISNDSEATIYVDKSRDMKGKGLVLSKDGWVTKFVEKPEKPIEGAGINSGCYVLNKSILDKIPDGFSDFAKDILPEMVSEGNVFSLEHKGHIFDIGTPEDLKHAREYLINKE